MTTKHAASIPFNAATYLTPDDVHDYLAEALADGDHRMLPVALRTAADVLGMSELARRTGLGRESLYRTLSDEGNPRLDTLGAILAAFGLRIAVRPKKTAQALRKNTVTKVKAAKKAVSKKGKAVKKARKVAAKKASKNVHLNTLSTPVRKRA